MTGEPTSKSQANRAGERLKKFIRAGGDLRRVKPGHEMYEAVLVAQEWRSQFSTALVGVSMGIRSMSNTCRVKASVGQRHKRLERIVQKLARPNSTQLGKMQDIAGVRAVVNDLKTLRKLERHVRSRWTEDVTHTSGEIVYSDDYIVDPRSSGYRGLHLIVVYNNRPAELQLRTQNQHFWAEMVERTSRTIGVELKASDGPPSGHGVLPGAGGADRPSRRGQPHAMGPRG